MTNNLELIHMFTQLIQWIQSPQHITGFIMGVLFTHFHIFRGIKKLITTIANEIRLATSQNKLHALVRDNQASPRGICNCSKTVIKPTNQSSKPGETSLVFCVLDYGHEGDHVNGYYQWKEKWPPELVR